MNAGFESSQGRKPLFHVVILFVLLSVLFSAQRPSVHAAGLADLAPDGYEPDDTAAQATLIAPGTPQTHSIYPIGDIDWVQFTLTSTSAITLETDTANPGDPIAYDSVMWLYDSSGYQIDYNDDKAVGNLGSLISRPCGITALPKGTYYVKVGEFFNDNAIPTYSLSYNITNAACPTNTDVIIGGNLMGSYDIPSGLTGQGRYFSTLDGPVRVTNTSGQPTFTSQVVASNGSYNEIMGYPSNKFTSDWWFPFYDHGYPSVVGDNMRTWILVGNPSATLTATVNISIGGTLMPGSPFTVGAGSRITPRWIGTVGGPVHVSSNIPIFASERVFTVPDNSFNETMGYPANQFTTEYWFPWYDDVNMTTYIKVGNTSSTDTANVDIYVGATKEGSYTIAHDDTMTQSYPLTVDGPVRVVSTNGINIVTSQWTLSGTSNSFNEIMGYPFNQFTTEYWFPNYDHGYPSVPGDNMRTWVLVGNPSTSLTATVNIYIGNVLQTGSPFSIGPGGRVTPRWIGTVNGSVHVVSDIPVFTSERVFTAPSNSFNEMMGYPASQFTTEYWFPWYDSVNMPNSISISRP